MYSEILHPASGTWMVGTIHKNRAEPLSREEVERVVKLLNSMSGKEVIDSIELAQLKTDRETAQEGWNRDSEWCANKHAPIGVVMALRDALKLIADYDASTYERRIEAAGVLVSIARDALARQDERPDGKEVIDCAEVAQLRADLAHEQRGWKEASEWCATHHTDIWHVTVLRNALDQIRDHLLQVAPDEHVSHAYSIANLALSYAFKNAIAITEPSRAGAAGLVWIISEHACANNVMSATIARLRDLCKMAADESAKRRDPDQGGPFCENGLTYETEELLRAAGFPDAAATRAAEPKPNSMPTETTPDQNSNAADYSSYTLGKAGTEQLVHLFTELQKIAHANSRSKGFWQVYDFIRNADMDHSMRGQLTTIWNLSRTALEHEELGEKTQGERKGLVDDHLPHRPMVVCEAADTIIRLMDEAGAHGWPLMEVILEKMAYNAGRPFMHGKGA